MVGGVRDSPQDSTPWISKTPRERVEFQQADILTVDLPKQAFDAVLIASVFHHFQETTNRELVHRAAKALRSGGIVIAVDAVRPAALEKSEQVESLLDLYFGAASRAGLWTIDQLRLWQKSAGLELLPPLTLRLLPCCRMQVGRKSCIEGRRLPAALEGCDRWTANARAQENNILKSSSASRSVPLGEFFAQDSLQLTALDSVAQNNLPGIWKERPLFAG